MFLADQIHWGDAPTWVGAIAAVGAAVFAAASFKKLNDQGNEQTTFITEQRRLIAEQLETLELQRQALRARAEDRSSSQARQIRMVVEKSGHQAVARVFNDSASPIGNVEVKFGPYIADVLEVHPDNFQRPRGNHTSPVHLVGPGRVFEFWLRNHSEQAVQNNQPLLRFTDAQGVDWQLDEHGDLRR